MVILTSRKRNIAAEFRNKEIASSARHSTTFIANMKQALTISNSKEETVVSKVNTECGRMEYLGVDMAFIYIRGKLMFTMSEVARNLYPLWPRATLNIRVKQLKLQWHTCTPKEIEKVLSVKGIVKYGLHCTLISKEDLDMFSSVYKIGTPAGPCKHTLETKLSKNEAKRREISEGSTASRILRRNRSAHMKPLVNLKANSKIGSTYDEQSRVNGNKSEARVIVKLDKGATPKEHAVKNKRNKMTGKHGHVVKLARYETARKQLKRVGRPNKRPFLESEPRSEFYDGHIPTKRHRKMRDASLPDSDSLSHDSGISSLGVTAPRKRGRPRKTDNHELGSSAAPKNQKQRKLKEVKRKYTALKIAKQTSKQKLVESKRKSNIHKNGRKNKKCETVKKRNMKCSNTITKDLIMDLKNMNDKDLINSFSPLSSVKNTPSADQKYLFKLMPVKPVWRINSSFKFMSHFQLPPSLVIHDGQLLPACSMICHPGRKPPSAHPVWKWRVGGPVISNKTVISYRMKKVKCP